jgi:uracil-DNA glycosylase
VTTYPDIDALHADLRRCRRCAEAGHPIDSPPIFSGAQTARLFLIGQAPGGVEGESRLPFSGPSGKRLFRWLEQAGWREAEFRQRCYVSAVTKCFPGKHANGRGDRVPTAAERALCRPWLDAELALVAPEVIVPVGRLAINLFYEDKPPLVDVVGSSKRHQGRLVVPLPHPSGASAWTNDPENQARVEQALAILGALKEQLDL